MPQNFQRAAAVGDHDANILMPNIFILLPSPHPTGPIKGAIALANVISKQYPTTIVYLKNGPGVDTPMAPSIRIVSLADHGTLLQKIFAYRNMIRKRGDNAQGSVSLSFCFSADFTNLFCPNAVPKISYVRGNLPVNYQYEFGKIGFMVGVLHLFSLRWFRHVVAMNAAMADQIERFSGKRPHIVGNFVDETYLGQYRNNRAIFKEGPFRFIYVGRLTALKRVQAILHAARTLKRNGCSFHLDVVGDGELLPELIDLATQCHIEDIVTFHGHQKFPYDLMAQADCLVLPSITEGVSRSVLEALYLGVPCLVRNIDGNGELITNGVNGYVFQSDAELVDLMIKTARLSRKISHADAELLPDNYRQAANTRKLIGIIDGGT